MADTSEVEQQGEGDPQSNGPVDGLDDERGKLRPADIDAVSEVYILCIQWYQWSPIP